MGAARRVPNQNQWQVRPWIWDTGGRHLKVDDIAKRAVTSQVCTSFLRKPKYRIEKSRQRKSLGEGIDLERVNRESNGKVRVSVGEAWSQMPRSHRITILILIFYLTSGAVAHLIAWVRHRAILVPELVAFAMLSMLVVCIWHSLKVKGLGPTVAFFLICWSISWLCEYIGHNRGWFFGHYHYTKTLGVAIGGVPLIIIVTWSVVIYSSFMVIDWLVGMGGVVKLRSWWGRALWSTLIASATATLVCAWDLMVDPMATSYAWWTGNGRLPWWYWIRGGPYLRELPGIERIEGWEGAAQSGVPIGNMVGWWIAPFFMVFIFYLFFQRANIVSGSLFNLVPLLVYFYVYFTLVFLVLEMNWYVQDMTQVALIGTFTMLPVILTSLVKLVWDYT